MLKTNKTLAVLDLSGNEIGYWEVKDGWGDVTDSKSTPEGPAALAEGLRANQSVQQLDASGNELGQASKDALTKAKPPQLLQLQLD